TVASTTRTFAGMLGKFLRVCWFESKLYWAYAFKLSTTTRYTLRNISADSFATIRWFVDDQAIPNGDGSLTVNFESADKYFGSPQDALADKFPGGPATLQTKANGTTLEITNAGGEGVFFGKVRALYNYPGDPSIFPPGLVSVADLLDLGYVRED